MTKKSFAFAEVICSSCGHSQDVSLTFMPQQPIKWTGRLVEQWPMVSCPKCGVLDMRNAQYVVPTTGRQSTRRIRRRADAGYAALRTVRARPLPPR